MRASEEPPGGVEDSVAGVFKTVTNRGVKIELWSGAESYSVQILIFAPLIAGFD